MTTLQPGFARLCMNAAKTLFVLHLSALAANALALEDRYVLVAAGAEVYDKKTDLSWSRCSVGQRWKGEEMGCVGVQKKFTWDEAQKIPPKGWRVPTKEEQQTLVDFYKAEQGDLARIFFPDETSRLYWSGSPSGKAEGWCTHFDYGYTYDDVREHLFAVRLVRDGQ